MKKLNLRAAVNQRVEVLTRGQLRMVSGGSDKWIGSYGMRCDESVTREGCVECCSTDSIGIPFPYQCIEDCRTHDA